MMIEVKDKHSGAILFKKDPDSINIQKLTKRVEELESKNRSLEKKLNKLEKLINK